MSGKMEKGVSRGVILVELSLLSGYKLNSVNWL